MTSASTIADLRLRIAGATGPDRALDCAIHKVLVGLKQYEDFYTRADGSICLRYYADPTGPSYYSLPRYTASVDAALALVEWLLPGQTVGPLTWQPSLKEPKGYARLGGGFVASEAPTLPLAILAALLNSLPADGRAA